MANPRPTILYADAIGSQAARWLRSYHLDSRGGVLTVRSYGEVSPCDVVEQVRSDLRGETSPGHTTPRLIALSFYGYTSACMHNEVIGSPDYLDEYETDLQRIYNAAAYVGALAYWIKPPPRQDGDLPGLTDTLATLAEGIGYHIVAAGEAVDDGAGGWIESLPCLDDEGVDEGCVEGVVDVRSGDGFSFVGEEYSSGARRWAAAAVQGMPNVASIVDPNCYVWECPT